MSAEPDDPSHFESQVDFSSDLPDGVSQDRPIKQEPAENRSRSPWTFKQNEIVNLTSDGEYDDDVDMADLLPAFQPSITSRAALPARSEDGLFMPEATPQASIAASTAGYRDTAMENNDPAASGVDGPLDLGPSIFKSAGQPRPDYAVLRAQMLATQRKYAADFQRSRQAATQATGGLGGPDDSENGQTTPPRPDFNMSPPPAPKARGRGKSGSKDPATKRFETSKAAFEKKKRAGTANLQDEIEFMKLEAAESARLRKIEADEEYDRTPSPSPEADDGLFLSDNEDADAPGARYSTMVSDDEEEPAPKKRGRPKRARVDDDDEDAETPKRSKAKNGNATKKKGRKVGGTNYTDADLEDVLERAKRQKIEKTAANARKKGGAAGKTKVAPKAKAKAGPSMTNLNSLMGTDVFGDTAAIANLPNQPLFEQGGGKRPEQLKRLIASVPTGSNRKIAAADKRYLDEAIKNFTGHGTVRPADDGNWSVKGMRSTLKHYQIMGTAFMRRREGDTHEPKGGILADQMGLGKTVMMLANIVNGKPKDKVKHRATLMVASPALVTQWQHEIEKHTMSKREHKQYGLGTVLQYRAGSRLSSNNNMELLEGADIVLTTYHEVSRSYPKANMPTGLVTAAQKDTWWKGYYEQNAGVLHRAKWHRIVLDEAQAIKNHRAHTSMACRAINAKHHWAISGTPILNTVKEFYPYFKFLREPNTGSYKIFKENFCSPDDPEGSEKLGVFLRKFMIRRTHIDRLFDARLLDLPTPQEHTLWLEFNEVERQIYEIVKKRFIQRINSIAKQGGLEKHYSHIWTMILRLRQICGHILLVQGTVVDLLEREDFEKLNKITESEEEMSEEGASLLVHLRNVLKSDTGVKSIDGGVSGAIISENSTVPTGLVDAEDPLGQTGGKHGLNFRFRKYLNSLVSSEHWDAITQRCLCSGCRQTPSDPQVTSCFHIYCKTCLDDLAHLAAKRGHDQARCSECGEAYHSSQACEGLETFERRESTAASTSDAQAQPAKKGRKGKKKDDDMEDWIGMKGEVLPSAKTMAVKAQVQNWLEDDAEAKIIIYTQFIPMVRILGKICQTEEWGYVTYTGQMSHDSRDKAITEFGSNPDKKIMLASLKCGGLGLNLTMASRVICLDPWWNSAVEQQAFCRVFRIGQQKETRMTRFVVKNTIDGAMMATKERKQLEIDEVMEDKSGKRKGSPSVADLMRLFGSVGEGSNGRPFIFASGSDEYDEGDPEHLRMANIDSEDEE